VVRVNASESVRIWVSTPMRAVAGQYVWWGGHHFQLLIHLTMKAAQEHLWTMADSPHTAQSSTSVWAHSPLALTLHHDYVTL